MSYDTHLAAVQECDRLYVVARSTRKASDWRAYITQTIQTAALLRMPVTLGQRPNRKHAA